MQHTFTLSTAQSELILRLLEHHKPVDDNEDMDAEFICETFTRTIEADKIRGAAYELQDALRELYDFSQWTYGDDVARSRAAIDRAGALLRRLAK